MTNPNRADLKKRNVLHMEIDPALQQSSKVLAAKRGHKNLSAFVRYLLLREQEIERQSNLNA